MSLDEVRKLSFLQFTKLLNAIMKKEKEYWLMFTLAVNNAFAGGKNLQNFVDNLKNINKGSEILSEKELKDFGFAKKG